MRLIKCQDDHLIQSLRFINHEKHESSGSCGNKIIPSSHKKIPLIREKFRVLQEFEVEDVVGSGAKRACNGYLKIVTEAAR